MALSHQLDPATKGALMDYVAFVSFLVLIGSWILLPDKDRRSEATTPARATVAGGKDPVHAKVA